MRLSKVRDAVVEVKIPFGEEFLTIQCRKGILTPELQSKLNKVQTGPDEGQREYFKEFLITMVAKWDLTDDDDVTIVPLTAKNIDKLPFDIILPIAKAINEVFDPPAPSAEPSVTSL